MKNLIQTSLFYVTLFLFAGCASSGVNVGADKRTEADLASYKTYNWVSDVAEIPGDQVFVGAEGILVFNNKSSRSSIKEAIQTQLEAKGFERETNNPDMLVNFTVLEEDDQLRTYTRDSYSYLGAGPVDQDAKMVDVEAGTILVNFIDADAGHSVWQGFASGALDESDVKNDKNLEAKVGAIFNEFNFNAFSMN